MALAVGKVHLADVSEYSVTDLKSLLRVRTGRSFTGVSAIVLTATLDIVLLGGFFAWSYVEASQLDGLDARIWKFTDATFCVGILYLMLASRGYALSILGNPVSQLSRLLVNGSILAALEWLALLMLQFAPAFPWPWNGPINIVSGAVVAMCLTRLLIYRGLMSLAERGLIARTVAVVGSGPHGLRLIQSLMQRREAWTRIIGIFDDRHDRAPREVEGYPVAGTVDDLIEYARERRVDEVLVALPWGAEARLLGIVEKLKVIPANVRLAPDVISGYFIDQGFSRVDGMPVYIVYRKPISGWGAMLKRGEDLILGTAIGLVALPLMLLCAVAIKLDSPGPVLFRQNRYGYNNRLIGVYKFRSMYQDRTDRSGSVQTTSDDPRVTRIGRLIRRTSLDELPQILNVLKGDMSLVGPRPHATDTKAAGRLFEEIVREYSARHKVKPGITGWAQVMGWRGETDTEEKIQRRVECDLYYMENWSVFLDIEIMVRTLFVLTGRNVY